MLAPGAVRFGKAVQEEDRLGLLGPAELDVERHSGGEADSGEGEIGHG